MFYLPFFKLVRARIKRIFKGNCCCLWDGKVVEITMLFLVKEIPTRKLCCCAWNFVYRFNISQHSRWSFRDDSTLFFASATRSKMKILFSFFSLLNRCDFRVISNIMWGIWGLTNRDLLRVDKFQLYDITKKGSWWVASRQKRLEYKVTIRLKIARLSFASRSPDNFICFVKESNNSVIWSKKFSPWIADFYNAIRQTSTACVWTRESFSSFDLCLCFISKLHSDVKFAHRKWIKNSWLLWWR